MDDYKYFKELSLKNLSASSLLLFEAASRVIRARFPNCLRDSGIRDMIAYPTLEDVEKWTEDCCPMPLAEGVWVEYADRLARSAPPDRDGGPTLSMWALSRGADLDDEIVEGYLRLLRATSLSIEIVEIRNLELDPGVNQILEGHERPAVIPFRDGKDWAFAVAYSDCVHWYDSRTDRTRPRFSAGGSRRVVEGWDGPKQGRPGDSGVFMLIGIRCILQGTPHLSQTVASKLAETFRPRMLIELLADRIDPGDADLQQIPPPSSPEESHFFDDAAFGTQLDRALEIGAMALTPPRSSSSASAAQTSPASTSSSSTSSRRDDDRRLILDHLSKAVKFKRSAGASLNLDEAVLWSLVKKSRFSSPLHQKFHAVLFYDKVAQLEGPGARNANSRKAKTRQSRCQFWKDVSRLGEQYGLGSYVALCAVSARSRRDRPKADEEKAIISGLERRFQNPTDPLLSLLRQARDLCDRTLLGSIPQERLMIENYSQNSDLVDRIYEAFASLDPHVRLGLPDA
ncbi:Fc.00g081810.m01.CDS01 [Cosmosporella sp. VM-42]